MHHCFDHDISMFSDDYQAAMAKIMVELRERAPWYSNPLHPHWERPGDQIPISHRREFIINCITCSVMRSSAIFAHNILGAADPDRPTEHFLDTYDPMGSLLHVLLYRTPSYYIDSQMPFMFRPRTNEFGYTLEVETVELLHMFMAIADVFATVTEDEELNG